MAADWDVRALLSGGVRGGLLLVGLAVFVLAVLVVFSPTVAAMVPAEALVAVLGSDYVVVAVVGIVAVAFAAVVLLVVAASGVDEAELPVVESIESAPHPGQAIDRSVAGRGGIPADRVERLTEAAVQTLVRAGHCSRTTAERQVAEGTWTSDRAAAALLSADEVATDRRSANRLFGGLDVTDGERVRRTTEAIVELDEQERASESARPTEYSEATSTQEDAAVDRDEAMAEQAVPRGQSGPDSRREGARSGGR